MDDSSDPAEQAEDQQENEQEETQPEAKKKNKYRKDKPWCHHVAMLTPVDPHAATLCGNWGPPWPAFLTPQWHQG